MPAGQGSRCRECADGERLQKRISINQACFASPEIAASFAEYATWLGDRVGKQKAAMTINRYLAFFRAIDDRWGCIAAYPALLAHFGAAELRRSLLPLTWLQQSGRITIDADLRACSSEQLRIDAAIERFSPNSIRRDVIESYARSLVRPNQASPTAIRSIRLALTPAVGLLDLADDGVDGVPDQGMLELYLKRTPGQHAALTGFVRHLNEEFGCSLLLPVRDPTAASRKRRRTAQRLLLTMMAADLGAVAQRDWIRAALAYFHDLRGRSVVKALQGTVIPDAEGWSAITVGARDYWIPSDKSASAQLGNAFRSNRKPAAMIASAMSGK